MPIKTRCQCGAAFAAPDTLAGKKVKCPKCSQPVQVPAGSAPAASSAPPLAVRCACGKALKVPATMAGKAVKCPGCGQPIKVPAAAAKRAAGDELLGALLDEVELSGSKTGRRCPSCRRDLGPEDVICIGCGFNVETGKQIKTKKVEKKKVVGGVVLEDDAPKGPQKKEEAPAAVKTLAKLLNQAGTLILVVAFLIVAFRGYQAMQADPAQGVDALIGALTDSGIYVIIGALVLGTVPYIATAKLVESGNAAGRILSIVLGIVAVPLLVGALILKLSFSDTVVRYCK